MNLVETETSLDTYIRWIREGGLTLTSQTSAVNFWLYRAIKEYGLEKVRQEIEPIIPEIIETTYRRAMKLWTEDSGFEKEQRQLHESFRAAYNKGEEINIGPITVKKKD